MASSCLIGSLAALALEASFPCAFFPQSSSSLKPFKVARVVLPSPRLSVILLKGITQSCSPPLSISVLVGFRGLPGQSTQKVEDLP